MLKTPGIVLRHRLHVRRRQRAIGDIDHVEGVVARRLVGGEVQARAGRDAMHAQAILLARRNRGDEGPVPLIGQDAGLGDGLARQLLVGGQEPVIDDGDGLARAREARRQRPVHAMQHIGARLGAGRSDTATGGGTGRVRAAEFGRERDGGRLRRIEGDAAARPFGQGRRRSGSLAAAAGIGASASKRPTSTGPTILSSRGCSMSPPRSGVPADILLA